MPGILPPNQDTLWHYACWTVHKLDAMLTASLFLVAYFLACFLALVRHPVFGLLAYLAAFYFHPPTRWWSYALPDLRWSFLAAAFTFVGILIHRRKLQSGPVLRNGVVQGLVLFVIWIVIQSAWALNEQMHFNLLEQKQEKKTC